MLGALVKVKFWRWFVDVGSTGKSKNFEGGS